MHPFKLSDTFVLTCFEIGTYVMIWVKFDPNFINARIFRFRDENIWNTEVNGRRRDSCLKESWCVCVVRDVIIEVKNIRN